METKNRIKELESALLFARRQEREYPDRLKKLKERYEGKFFVLPYSHEWIRIDEVESYISDNKKMERISIRGCIFEISTGMPGSQYILALCIFEKKEVETKDLVSITKEDFDLTAEKGISSLSKLLAKKTGYSASYLSHSY